MTAPYTDIVQALIKWTGLHRENCDHEHAYTALIVTKYQYVVVMHVAETKNWVKFGQKPLYY